MRRLCTNSLNFLIKNRAYSTCSPLIEFENEVKLVTEKKNIIGLEREILEKKLNEEEFKPHVIKAIWKYLYTKGIHNFNDIPDFEIGIEAKKKLNEIFEINYGTVKAANISQDKTRKWLIEFGKDRVESWDFFTYFFEFIFKLEIKSGLDTG